MPIETNPQGISFDDAPGGDLDLDSLFGDSGDSTNGTQQTTAVADTKPLEAATQTTATQEPFLKTSGSVYKTADEAVKGIEHKDSLIAQLRQQLQEATGADPLRRQAQQSDSDHVNYTQDKKRYFKDMAKAVEAKDEDKYIDIQRKFVLDALAPLAPAITTLVQTQARSAVESEIKDFGQFHHSEDYTKTLDRFPLLKQAITVAESNPDMSGQLPEFYKMAYYANQGARLPEIVQRQQPTAAPVARPTVTSTPVTAPATQERAVRPSLETAEGRKALIEQQERLGVENLRF